MSNVESLSSFVNEFGSFSIELLLQSFFLQIENLINKNNNKNKNI